MKCEGCAVTLSCFVTYNGLLDALGRSQVLPYLQGLGSVLSMRVLSFERLARLQGVDIAELQQHLRRHGIGWDYLRYHRRPSLVATSWDIEAGRRLLRRMFADLRPAVLHARGYVSAEIVRGVVGGDRFLFDIRGLMPEEYVDGEIWAEGSLKYRLAKRSEQRFFARADGAVVLADAIRPYVEERFRSAGREVPVAVIPCCVDTEQFRFDPADRERLRSELGVAEHTALFVYSGSVGTWYLAHEMARYVDLFRRVTGRSVLLLWLVNNDWDLAREASDRAGLGESERVIMSVGRDEMPGYLSAADVGLALVKPCFSKKASSPTKYAEYLACGLPIVLSREVGDSALLERDGVAVDCPYPFDELQAVDAVRKLEQLTAQPREVFREYAVKHFDLKTVGIPRYEQIYAELLEQPRAQAG